MKTLAEILADAREQAQITVEVIDKLIAESKESGTYWPELEDEFEVNTFNDVE
jgi:hypothetical protein